MKSKAIIIDLDGTAVDSPIEKLPTQALIKEVKRIQSTYYLSAATGRVWSFAKHVLKALNFIDPCIISAGTQICDPRTGEILWQKNIDPDALKQVISVLQDYPEYKVLFNDGTEDDYFNGGISPTDFNTTESVYFFEQVFIPNKIAKDIYSKLSEIAGTAIVMVVSQKDGCNDIHVVNKEATKEQAVAKLIEILSIDQKNTIGIGDGNNDVHLFNAVQYKVAMGNAVDELKHQADEIIGNVSDDGLVEYFRGLV